jgi:hypothetical protein
VHIAEADCARLRAEIERLKESKAKHKRYHRKYYRMCQRMRPVVEFAGQVLDHDCDAPIHPTCWRGLREAYDRATRPEQTGAGSASPSAAVVIPDDQQNGGHHATRAGECQSPPSSDPPAPETSAEAQPVQGGEGELTCEGSHTHHHLRIIASSSCSTPTCSNCQTGPTGRENNMNIYVDSLIEWSPRRYRGSGAAMAARTGARNGHRWCHLFADITADLYTQDEMEDAE